MPTIPLDFPILVTPLKKGYHLRPLFTSNPSCFAKRFRDAVDLLSKEVRRKLRGFETSAWSIDELLWFTFNPNPKLELKKLCFALGPYMVFGDFTIVRFSLKGHQILCLPKFDDFFAILSDNLFEYGSFTEQVTTIVHDCLQQQRKKNPNNFSPNKYYANGNEFVTTVSLQVNVKRAPFPFEESADTWFASVSNQQQNFSGAVELARVGLNLGDKYPNNLQRASLRDDQVTRLGKLIFGTTMTAVVIVGPVGCGRTTLLHETFYRYLQEQERSSKSRQATIWHLDPNRIIAGMSIVGMWQRRFESILEYVIQGNQNKPLPPSRRPRLFIDNLVALFRIGKSAQNSLTLSDVLKPYLEQRSLTLIAEVNPQEWSVIMEMDRRFADLCQVFRVDELNLIDTASIAILARARLEQIHECEVDSEAMSRIFSLINSGLGTTTKPGNVVGFLERLIAKHRHGHIGVAQVEMAISEISRMNIDLLDRQKTLRYETVQAILASQLIGQPQAITCLVDVIQTIKAGLYDPKKPMANLLFIGPTGVGKTQAAKVLTHYLFSDEEQLVRFDMNEFVTDADVRRLIGTWGRPDGLLTTKIRHKPFCVLLLDEIEKAHPTIHDLLLQVLGEGRLTDTLGRTTDFTNTICILTSNLGAEQAGYHVGFAAKNTHSSSYTKAVEDFFRPELLNRIDRMVVFNSLQLQDAIAITRLQLSDLLQRDGFVRRSTILNIAEAALVKVAKQGFDAVLGGRALKRAIERDLTALAAAQLIKLSPNQPIILDIDWHDQRLQPHITALVPLPTNQTVPPLPESSLENFSQLAKCGLALQERLYDLRDSRTIELCTPNEEIRLLLTMQETLFEVKEQLDELIWAMEMARDPTETRFSSTSQSTSFHSWSKAQYMNSTAFYAQQDIRDYLEEMYVLAPKLIQESQSNWLNLLMSITFLDFFCQGIESNQQESVTLSLRSRVHGCGAEELDYLVVAYEKALTYLGIEVTSQAEQGRRYLHIKGPRLATLLTGEEGIHLFHPSNENALPIQVILDGFNMATSDSLPIIRNYALSEDGKTGGVLTDLRTGMLNRSGLGAHEWALLWYAQIKMDNPYNFC